MSAWRDEYVLLRLTSESVAAGVVIGERTAIIWPRYVLIIFARVVVVVIQIALLYLAWLVYIGQVINRRVTVAMRA